MTQYPSTSRHQRSSYSRSHRLLEPVLTLLHINILVNQGIRVVTIDEFTENSCK